ncbi:hypothetical protein BD410DRAFT_170450 [Rickenella mellea]|uniref:F-box domain-containing protein n=1 Tax=Rickenella mellea TaxID=50990 RepID=A0A4Y7Q680_9AGAM|nr:hypothetical protein BD410DRAFT_170450 [Rickenella mellea]
MTDMPFDGGDHTYDEALLSSPPTYDPWSTEALERIGELLDEPQHYEPMADIVFPEISFIGRLPPELLAQVFLHSAACHPDSPSRLSQVCKAWRDVAHMYSSVWQHVNIICNTEPDLQRMRHKAEYWLERSKVVPVDIGIVYGDTQYLLPLLSYVVPAVQRWQNAIFVGLCAAGITPHFHCDGKNSHLDSLAITLSHPDPNDVVTEDTDLLEEAAQRIKMLSFNDQHLKLRALAVVIHTFPSSEHMAQLSTLTELNIIHSSFDDSKLTPHHVLDFVSVCPSLESIYFDNGWCREPEPHDPCIDIPVTTIPHLRTLSLRCLTSIRCFLSHISTPALENLSLIHINTSNEFDPENPGEPGDSDDEANDFSQSPWTDHATGMGLRKLFSRCTPPIRVFDMDYADLRTKDFKWLFSNFTELETLRVVASDMSDNVARALQPTETWRPLPRLTQLELCQCQKLSGEAVERMVKARYNGGKDGLVMPLEQMNIINCMGVSVWNYHSIAHTFKPRDGLSYIPFSDN